MSRLKGLIDEIHRRSLWQVLLVYLGVSWGVLEAAALFRDEFGLPDWLLSAALGLLITGLVVVLLLAFVPEPGGVAGDPQEDRLASHRHLLTWRRAASIFVVTLAAWGVVATGWLVFGERAGRSEGAALPEAAAPVDAGWLSIESSPTDASVTATAVEPASTFSDHPTIELGQTPIADFDLAPGEYLIRLESEGKTPIALLAQIAPNEHTAISGRLVSADDGDMLYVSEGTYPGAPAGLAVQSFLIDSHEVTNAKYLEFISAGGYESREYWPQALIIDGESTPQADALKTFVDQTFLPGPRNWSGGLYPEGKGDHPVVGVSWYEAAAYARWAGKKLPTWHQWWRAALGEDARAFPWGNDAMTAEVRANFGLVDTQPVGSHPIGASPFGVQDMAGNVQEWLRELEGDPPQARAVGGSWTGPPYNFEPTVDSSFDPAYASHSTGFRCVKPIQ
jgi:formylglycine-generating enzyme required for sulfatase activity